MTDVVGELTTRGEDFRTRWAVRDVHAHCAGSSRSATPSPTT
ncbi:hypothetical protein ACQP2Y_17870 [Actinoplanes sp. CA-051413]